MKLELAMVEAHIGGLSVIEIARLLHLRAKNVHDLLRKNNAIEPLEVKPARTHDCNGIWLKALHIHGLSLERWCIGWRFTPAESLQALNGSENAEVHEALMRDFPNQYRKVFKIKPTWALKVAREKAEHGTYMIKWDEEKGQYRGMIVDEEESATTGRGLSVFGLTPTLTMVALEDALKKSRRISRLEASVNQYQAWANNPHKKTTP